MFNGIDFYSDTLTKPSIAMKKAMMDAPLGDEQKGEDPSTKQLEEKMARILGKSAAMFFPSATMCNQIAVFMHSSPGDEIIGAQKSHIFNYEAGGASFHSRVQTRGIETRNGTFGRDLLKKYHRPSPGYHGPKTALICAENTANAYGGVVWPPHLLQEVCAFARDVGAKSHLDGARLFNAAVKGGVSAKDLASAFDTVTVCFSKGLGCPMGAVLGFDEQDFVKVRRLKQVFGGALRQSGIVASACLFAVENNIERLKKDHSNAQMLADKMSGVKWLRIENNQPETNMVYFSIDEEKMPAEEFLPWCYEQGLRFSGEAKNRFRAVTHMDISEPDIERAVAKLKKL